MIPLSYAKREIREKSLACHLRLSAFWLQLHFHPRASPTTRSPAAPSAQPPASRPVPPLVPVGSVLSTRVLCLRRLPLPPPCLGPGPFSGSNNTCHFLPDLSRHIALFVFEILEHDSQDSMWALQLRSWW